MRSPTPPHVYHSRPYYQLSASEKCVNICTDDEESSNTFIVRLSKPWHHFDSNHWFHGTTLSIIVNFYYASVGNIYCSVSEYYMSRHQHAALSQIRDDSTLIIISDDPGFASNVTEMTMFIMMASFTQGRLFI